MCPSVLAAVYGATPIHIDREACVDVQFLPCPCLELLSSLFPDIVALLV